MASYYACQDCGKVIKPYNPLYMYNIDGILCDDCREKNKTYFD